MLEPRRKAHAASVNPSSCAASSSQWSWTSGMGMVAPPRALARDWRDGRPAAERECARQGGNGCAAGRAASSTGGPTRLRSILQGMDVEPPLKGAAGPAPCCAASCRQQETSCQARIPRHVTRQARQACTSDARSASRLVGCCHNLGRTACDARRILAERWLGAIGAGFAGLVRMEGRPQRRADRAPGWARVYRCACCAD